MPKLPKKIIPKIIQKAEAVKMGLTKNNSDDRRSAGANFVIGMVGRKGAHGDEIVEVHRIDLTTKKKEVLHETKEYKALKTKLSIK